VQLERRCLQWASSPLHQFWRVSLQRRLLLALLLLRVAWCLVPA
jgi:hypothetical protein